MLLAQQLLHPHPYHRRSQLYARSSSAEDVGGRQSEGYGDALDAQHAHEVGQELPRVPRGPSRRRSPLRTLPR